MIYFKTNFVLQRLMEEIKRNMDNIENCEKNAKAYIDSVKVFFCCCFFHRRNLLFILAGNNSISFTFRFQDYEFQILTYRALQDPIASPLKKPKMECASDDIIQEVGFNSVCLKAVSVCLSAFVSPKFNTMGKIKLHSFYFFFYKAKSCVLSCISVR